MPENRIELIRKQAEEKFSDVPDSATFAKYMKDDKKRDKFLSKMSDKFKFDRKKADSIIQSELKKPTGFEELTKTAEAPPVSTTAHPTEVEQPRTEEDIKKGFEEKFWDAKGQLKWIPARIFSAFVERPSYAVSELAARAGKTVVDLFDGESDKASDYLQKYVDYYSQPEKHGLATPYAAKGSRLIRKDAYKKGFLLGVLHDMAEMGTDVSAYIGQVAALGKLTPSSPIFNEAIMKGNKLTAVGRHLKTIGIHSFLTSKGDVGDRMKSTIARLGYNITPYIANATGAMGLTATTIDIGLNSFLSTPTYARYYKEVGGLNKEFLALALPQFAADVTFALKTRGLPENKLIKDIEGYRKSRAKELQMTKDEFVKFTKDLQLTYEMNKGVKRPKETRDVQEMNLAQVLEFGKPATPKGRLQKDVNEMNLVQALDKNINTRQKQDLIQRAIDRGVISKDAKKHPIKVEKEDLSKDREGRKTPTNAEKEVMKLEGERIEDKFNAFSAPTKEEIYIEKQLSALSAAKNVARVIAQREAKGLSEYLKENNLKSDKKMGKILDAVQEGNLSSLTAKERTAGLKWKETADRAWKKAHEEGVLNKYVENYVRQAYKNKDKSIKDVFFSKSSTGLYTKPSFAKQRKYGSRKEAREAGLDPINDMALLTENIWESLNVAIASKQFVQAVKPLKTKEGKPLISNTKIKNYERLEIPQLAKWYYFKDKESGEKYSIKPTGVYVHPAITGAMKTLGSGARDWGAIRKSWDRATRNIKRIIMHNPVYHGKNIYSDQLDEFNFNFIKTAKVINPFIGREKKDKVLKKEIKGLEDPEANRLDMIEHNMSADIAGQAARDVYNRARDDLPEMFKYFSKLATPVRKVKEKSDRMLFRRMIQSAQEATYFLKKAKCMEKGKTADEAGYMAAHYTNDLYGTLPRNLFTKKQADYLDIVYFARNWTVSNLRLLTGAAGYTGNLLPRFLSHKDLTKDEAKMLSKEYKSHLLKGVFAYMLQLQLLNYAFTGHSSFENEPGKKMRVDSDYLNKRGGRMFIKLPLFAYIEDQMKWIGGLEGNLGKRGKNILKTQYNKMEPLLKTTAEVVMNKSLWQKGPITEPGTPAWEAAKEKARYFIEGISPWGMYSERPGKVKTLLEKFAPVFGVWVSNGMPGGEFAIYTVDFKQKKKYEEGKIQEKINELIQTGDYAGAVVKMVEEKNLKDLESMINQLNKYKSSLIYTFKSLRSYRDKYEFIFDYLPNEKDKDPAKYAKEILKDKELLRQLTDKDVTLLKMAISDSAD